MAQKLRYPTSQNFVQKTLGAQLLAGVTAAVTLNNVTGIQNKPGVMIVDRIDTNGVETPTKREVIAYDATSGVTCTTLTRNADSSGSDQDHAVGAIVEFGPDILWAQALIDGLSQVIDPTTGLILKATGSDITTGTNDTKIVTPKAIADAGLVIDTDATLAANSDAKIASQKATKTALTTGTFTLTNKRITPRVVTAANYTTDTGTSLNCDTTDIFIVTAQAGALKFNNPSGTPTDGQKLWLAVTGTGARALTYDTQFESSAGATLPTTTVTTARIDIGLVWRADTSKWHCVAVA